MNNSPKFYKTEQGEVINLAMITQMYKRTKGRNDGIYTIELAGGTSVDVTEYEMGRIYVAYKVNV